MPGISAATPLLATMERMRAAFLQAGPPSYAQRRDQLRRLRAEVLAQADAMAAAISQDFGNRSRQETQLAEVFPVVAGLRHTQRHLRRWMQERRVSVGVELWPGRAYVRRQPLGVVGIISPWNYPAQLALLPLVAAIAAGNRVMLKPSEITPRTSAFLEQLLGRVFTPDEVAVVQGGRDVGQAFGELPFDHLFYTGSTAVGRSIMHSAAENLTPVTLELGGKSPAIIAPDARLPNAADSILYGKLLNAGQTCIAPDYVLVPEALEPEFVRLAKDAASRMFPSVAGNPDYTSVVSDTHWKRLQGYLAECRAQGAEVVPLTAASDAPDTARRTLPPVLIRHAKPDSAVMRDEIFGPLLPVIPYRRLEDAIAFVNARPRPLALYVFTESAAHREQVLTRIVAGGVTVNDTLLHFGAENLPFGGVGASGMGHYHGEYGFETFTKRQPIFRQARFNLTGMIRPPYGKKFDALVKWMIGR
ncbi:MAG TPA: coniferyl aldehyde dehydrogenase [bacterium]